MCGICFTCLIACGESGKTDSVQDTKDSIGFSPASSVLKKRGPDSCIVHTLNLTDTCKGIMVGCVLHLRGDLTPQPVTDGRNNALLWNGEIFDGIQVKSNENDTQVLFDALSLCTTDTMVLKVLESIHGPWAFIYWQADAKKLWFGRDMLGRRSLLWHLPSHSDDQFILSSVSNEKQEYSEIPSVGIFALDFTEPISSPTLTLYPWLHCRWPGTTDRVLDTPQSELIRRLFPLYVSNLTVKLDYSEVLTTWIPNVNRSLDIDNLTPERLIAKGQFQNSKDLLHQILINEAELNILSDALIEILQRAVEKRVINLPQYKFSKIQENVLSSDANIAVLFSGGLDSTVLAALADRCLPPDQPIDLLNVAFEQKPTVKQKNQKQRLKRQKQRSVFNENSGGSEHVSEKKTGNGPEDVFCNDRLSAALECECNIQTWNGVSPPNDVHSTEDLFDPFKVPDRETGRRALSELNPNRKWNFIEINVMQEEVQMMRQSRICNLIYPLQTVLDDSIGCAVWFASRGVGVLGNDRKQAFKSKARVILCGMAADEQFAGYSRHRVTFNTKGWEGLVDEIEQEMWRISARNLGRDDRIITDHGKESRFPFLDETFTKFVSTIPVYNRADLRLPRGIGEKLLLRLCAFKLGLHKTAVEPKRAIHLCHLGNISKNIRKMSSSVSQISNILLNKKAPLKDRFRALFTLRNLGGNEAVDSIAACFDDDSALLKHELAYCLGQMQNTHAIPHLIKVLEDRSENAMVRHEAGEALGAIGDSTALEVLKQFVNDPVVEVAETCQLAVHRIQWVSENSNSETDLPKNPYYSVDPAPPSKLRDVKDLKEALLDESLPLFQRYRAMFTLRNIGTTEAVLALAEGLKCKGALFRHEIAYVLGQIQSEACVQQLKENLEDAEESPMVRHECAEALGSIATSEATAILEKYIKDKERVVRESAIVALDMSEYENSDAFQYADTLSKLKNGQITGCVS
ncbi:Asparagine synthetase domain-containing protein 1 [Bulinus truncatus]|nr:Asparagine synthetase domain-containing protein 1 [Bulinus truncatus]